MASTHLSNHFKAKVPAGCFPLYVGDHRGYWSDLHQSIQHPNTIQLTFLVASLYVNMWVRVHFYSGGPIPYKRCITFMEGILSIQNTTSNRTKLYRHLEVLFKVPMENFGLSCTFSLAVLIAIYRSEVILATWSFLTLLTILWSVHRGAIDIFWTPWE